ncbi:hypothetical protein BGX33_005419 [Mortierella sp. NVP41]|nr:hypothetical protein BGX33_005419 [Mortierella sp. NVP41]
MNSAQYGYHHYPSPSQTQAQAPQQLHSNEHAQSPVNADNEQQQHIMSNAGVPSSSALQSPQGHTTSLLPMPSPALAAATAANTAANTNTTGSRQMILQQYQNQQQQQQQHHQLGMGVSMQPSSANGGNPVAINTAMMALQPPSGYLLPSPQSAGASGQPPLPILPPQSTDLDTILAKYANQPELLKLIIASKTEEDRRWAEEARYRMMDLIMRGENRGLGFMVGYEALGGIPGNMPGMMGMTAKRFMEEGGNNGSGGGYGQHGMFGGFSASGTAPGTAGPGGQGQGTSAQGSAGILAMGGSSTAAGTSSAGLPSLYAQTQMPNPFGMGMGGMTHGSQSMMGQTMGNNPSGFGQYMDPSLARKRSVTFAGEVHHMRSQSLSSMPTPNSVGQLGGMSSMLGMGGADSFGQQQQHPHQQASGLQNPQQYQYQGQSQHPQSMHYHQQSSPPPPPQFAGNNPYSHQQFGSQNTLPSLHHHGIIRRTNSLSHISQTTTVTEQRLVAGRPRNESSASMRTMDDDSDEDSDDDYENHPVVGMSSRPGSALSMHNNIGGNGETSLTLEFSDMASVSGGGSHHSHHDHGSGGPTVGSTGTTTTKGHHRTSSSISSMGGVQDTSAGSEYKRKRKRREMQPVNKIVDSPEPHIDPYLWKNNGNTTQKKTGCKSIYYKCSNSTAGCTVNKTVTEKEGGGYLTKYRGEHLEDCIRLKKAQQAAQAAQAAAQNGHMSIYKKEQ